MKKIFLILSLFLFVNIVNAQQNIDTKSTLHTSWHKFTGKVLLPSITNKLSDTVLVTWNDTVYYILKSQLLDSTYLDGIFIKKFTQQTKINRLNLTAEDTCLNIAPQGAGGTDIALNIEATMLGGNQEKGIVIKGCQEAINIIPVGGGGVPLNANSKGVVISGRDTSLTARRYSTIDSLLNKYLHVTGNVQIDKNLTVDNISTFKDTIFLPNLLPFNSDTIIVVSGNAAYYILKSSITANVDTAAIALQLGYSGSCKTAYIDTIYGCSPVIVKSLLRADSCASVGATNTRTSGINILFVGKSHTNTAGNHNVLIGDENENTAGSGNLLSGDGNINTAGSGNTICGGTNTNIAGNHNSIFGTSNTNVSGSGNFLGGDTDTNKAGSNNIIFGNYNENTAGDRNFIGGEYNVNTSGSDNFVYGDSNIVNSGVSSSGIIGHKLTATNSNTLYVNKLDAEDTIICPVIVGKSDSAAYADTAGYALLYLNDSAYATYSRHADTAAYAFTYLNDSAYANTSGNSDSLNHHQQSYYIDSSGTAQTKSGNLTISGNITLPTIATTTANDSTIVIENGILKKKVTVDITTTTLSKITADTLTVNSYMTFNGANIIAGVYTLVDDGQLILPTSTAGFGWAQMGDNAAIAQFSYTTAGVVSSSYTSGSVALTNIDATTMCIYDSGTTVTISNRSGGTLKLRVNITDSTN